MGTSLDPALDAQLEEPEEKEAMKVVQESDQLTAKLLESMKPASQALAIEAIVEAAVVAMEVVQERDQLTAKLSESIVNVTAQIVAVEKETMEVD